METQHQPVETKSALDFIKAQDPEGGERLKRLLERRSFLLDRNVYGERFTERQFDLVFDPLLRSAYEKARILEALEHKGREGCVAFGAAFHGQIARLRAPSGPGQEERGRDRRVRRKTPRLQKEVATVMEKVGKVLVIGGGIGGMEASLNLVEAGFKVYLVDEKPNIGGKMSQLDKTFPTNDCSMCIMAPKLVEVGRNANVELLMGSEVVALEGQPGNFTAVVKRGPRRIVKEKCTSCGLCAPYCPLEVSADYNEGLSRRSGAYINFPQAIPSTYSIDREIPPCVNRCPINLNARDYVGLIAEGSSWRPSTSYAISCRFPAASAASATTPARMSASGARKSTSPSPYAR